MRDAKFSRRAALGAVAGSVAGVLTGCGDVARPKVVVSDEPAQPTVVRTPGLATDHAPSPTEPAPTATPTPTPFPAGAEARALLAGTGWESPVSIRHSGAAGPTVLILGGVHGNEPGGWLAADGLATLEPATGSLIVLPRANQLAIADFVRTHDALGDLNRLYPGNAGSDLPMERMAAEVVALASEFRVSLVLDLHESWAFYSTRAQDGTAFLGQTITAGVGPRNPDFSRLLAERANSLIAVERDLMAVRDGSSFRRPDPATPSAGMQRGRSSLSLGGHVPGLTPILVEMGQEGQDIDRRIQLHLIVAREALAMLGVA